jgi:hypothetical protein
LYAAFPLAAKKFAAVFGSAAECNQLGEERTTPQDRGSLSRAVFRSPHPKINPKEQPMLSLSNWLRQTLRTSPTRRGPAAKRRSRVGLGVETLEDRTVPTILFTPHFSGTAEYAETGKTIAQEHASSLSSPSVVFIFSGSYWTTAQGKTDQQTLTTSMKSIMGGTYLSALNQYGSDGKALYYGSFQDNSTPTLSGQTPTTDGLKNYVQAEIKSHSSSVPSGSNVLYMVVNDPSHSYRSSSTFGLNWSNSSLHTAYVGAVALSGGAIDKDGFTWIFSHELAEAMVAAVHVTDPGKLGLGYQIADGEPENFGNGYTYRLSDGNLVQAYWSQRDSAWVVADGTSQKFTLGWATNTFNNNYSLQVNGDQLGVNYNDDITIDRSPNTSGTRVTMNGQSASFAIGTIKSLNVNTYGGYNTVHVKAVESGEVVDVSNYNTTSYDHVIVGSGGSLTGIQGAVNVSNSSGRTWLQIDDSNDAPRAITITDHSVTFQGVATINYTPYGGPNSGGVHGVMGLEIDDTWGTNWIDAVSVPAYMPVTVEGNPLDYLYGPAAWSVGLNRQGYLHH